MVRFSNKDWLALGWLARTQGKDASAVLREFAQWWTRQPGAAQPERPAVADVRSLTSALAALSAVLGDEEYIAEVLLWGLTYRGAEADRGFRVTEITKRLSLRAEADAAGAAAIGAIVDEHLPR